METFPICDAYFKQVETTSTPNTDHATGKFWRKSIGVSEHHLDLEHIRVLLIERSNMVLPR